MHCVLSHLRSSLQEESLERADAFDFWDELKHLVEVEQRNECFYDSLLDLEGARVDEES